MNYLAGRYSGNCVSNFIHGKLQQVKVETWRVDDDDTYSKRSELLLILHSPVRGKKYIKSIFGTPKELPVSERAPAFFLNCADLELSKLPPKQPRQVLVEQYPFHAIFATSA
jgi:hypothetical protein